MTYGGKKDGSAQAAHLLASACDNAQMRSLFAGA
jgi:hypothetical protein